MSESENLVPPATGWWKRIALVAIVAGAPAWLFSATQLWGWATKSSGPDFVVTATVERFILPPDEILEEIGVESVSTLAKLKSTKGVLAVTIKNVGDLDAEDVIFDANDSGFAAILFDDKSGDHLEFFSRRFDLGVIHSQQTVSMVIWGIENSFFEGGSPRILHRHGQFPVRLFIPLESANRNLTLCLAAVVILGIPFTITFYRRQRANIRFLSSLEQQSRETDVQIQELTKEIQIVNEYLKSKTEFTGQRRQT
ncbi:MAG: hypothetical protein IH831_02460 [Planctomycetes bacterium]|nr:hypothetical protein [Planctomycetota bacterium]